MDLKSTDAKRSFTILNENKKKKSSRRIPKMMITSSSVFVYSVRRNQTPYNMRSRWYQDGIPTTSIRTKYKPQIPSNHYVISI